MTFVFNEKELEIIKDITQNGCKVDCEKCPIFTVLNGEVFNCRYVADRIMELKKGSTVAFKRGETW